MKVKEIHLLEGYCPEPQLPCDQCSDYKDGRCTHSSISISLLCIDEDGNEVTITFPYDTVKVTIAGNPKL